MDTKKFTVISSKDTNNEQKQAVSDIDWSAKTILVAEDEDTNFSYLDAVLSRTKINIVRAKNGKEAVELIKIHPEINIILMDIKMPVMNGLEATRAIKSTRKDVVVIAQTAFAMDEDKRNCFAVGCDDFLAKPVRYRILTDTLLKYIK